MRTFTEGDPSRDRAGHRGATNSATAVDGADSVRTPLSVTGVSQLQRSAGNASVVALLARRTNQTGGDHVVQRQRRPAQAPATTVPNPADMYDPDRLAEQLMRAMVAGDRALSDPRLGPAQREELRRNLQTARRQLHALLAALRASRRQQQGSAASASAAPAGAMAGTLTLTRTVAQSSLRLAFGAALALATILSFLGLYGGGPTRSPVDDAMDSAREAFQRLHELLLPAMLAPAASAMAAPRTSPRTASPPVAVPRDTTRPADLCPPGAPVYDPNALNQRVVELFWDVPRLFAARSATVWTSAYLLHRISIGANNTAVLAIVDAAGCVRHRAEGTFIQGDVIHAEEQALAQLSLQFPVSPIPLPGWRLVVHTSWPPCPTRCALAIPLWSALHGVVPTTDVNNKWQRFFNNPDYLALCQAVVNQQAATPRPPRTTGRGRGRR